MYEIRCDSRYSLEEIADYLKRTGHYNVVLTEKSIFVDEVRQDVRTVLNDEPGIQICRVKNR